MTSDKANVDASVIALGEKSIRKRDALFKWHFFAAGNANNLATNTGIGIINHFCAGGMLY